MRTASSSRAISALIAAATLGVTATAQAAIVTHGTATGVSGRTTQITLPVPGAVVPGDAMLAVVTAQEGDSLRITPPSGWRLVNRQNEGGDLAQAVYVRIAGASEPASYAWALGTAVEASGGIAAYAGVDAAAPVDVAAGAHGNSNRLIAGSVTTTAPGDTLVAVFGVNRAATPTAPAGMSARLRAADATGRQATTLVADASGLAAGATGTRTSNPGASAKWVAQTIALRPASGGPGAPSAPVVGGGSASWRDVPSVTVTASGATDPDGISGYESRTSTDGGVTWTLAAPGASLTVTAEGETLVQFRAVDGLGNAGAWGPDGGATVRIDRTPPPAPGSGLLTGTSGAPTNASSVTVTAFVPDAASVEHRVSTDGGASWSVAAAGASVTVTAEGETLVQFRATDAAGNVSAWGPDISGGPEPAATVVIDRTAPSAPVLSAAADTTVPRSSRAGRVLLAATLPAGAVAVVITQDGRLVSDGIATTAIDAALADGTSYTYEAVARDAAGNESPPATATASTPDRTGPAAPAAPTGSGYPVSLAWPAVAGAVTYEVARDGTLAGTTAGTALTDAAAVDAAAPPAPAGLVTGVTGPGAVSVGWAAVTDAGSVHAVTVRGIDAEGNASAMSPVGSVVARSGVSHYSVSVDGVAVADVSGTSAGLTGLADGTHRIRVTAVDAEGNASATSVPATVVLSGGVRAPSRLSLAAASRFVRPGAPVRLTARLDGGAPEDVRWSARGREFAGGDVAETSFAEPGPQVVQAKLDDGTGQVLASASVEVYVDGTAPEVRIDPSGAAAQVSVADGESGLERVEWLPAGGPAESVPAAGIPLREGPNTVTVRATDRAGNVREVTREIRLDRTAPRFSAKVPVLVVGRSAVVALTAADDAGVAWIEYGARRFPGSTAKLVVPAGRRVTLAAGDAAGNRATLTFTVRRAPAVPRSAALRWAAGEPRLSGVRRTLLTSTWMQLQALRLVPARARPAGRYTRRLAATVRAYQRRAHLASTGTVDARTRARMARDLSRSTVTVTAH